MPEIERDDGALLAGIASGETSALEAFYDRYTGHAFGLAFSILRDRESAADAVQESFVTVWRNAGGFDGELGAARAWLLRTVYRRCVDQLRAERSRPRSDGEARLPEAQARANVPETALRNITGERVRRGMMTLPAEQRQVIELAYFGGETQDEIAAHLGLPLGTVKGRCRLALRKLRQVLGDLEG